MKIIEPSFEILSNTDENVLKKIEEIGRTCYKSNDKITEDSANKFVANLIKNGHEAMIEHVSVSVRITCDRGVSHEIVRHRVASYAQESTRYCNYSKDKFNNEINVIDIRKGIQLDTKMKDLSIENIELIICEWVLAMEDSEKHYMKMIKLGSTPQIARSVLPTSVKTEIIVTMNLREWRHFLKLRTASAAHPQMREIAIPILNKFKEIIPVVFDDIQECV